MSYIDKLILKDKKKNKKKKKMIASPRVFRCDPETYEYFEEKAKNEELGDKNKSRIIRRLIVAFCYYIDTGGCLKSFLKDDIKIIIKSKNSKKT